MFGQVSHHSYMHNVLYVSHFVEVVQKYYHV